MILVLFFVVLLIFAFVTSKIRLEIKNFKLSNVEDGDLIKELNFSFKLYIFGFIKIFQKNIDRDDLSKIKNSNRINRLKQKLKNNKKIKPKEGFSVVKDLKISLKKIDLNIKLGAEDPILTSVIVLAISVIVSIFLAQSIEKYDSKKYKYNILPNYDNKNTIKLNFLGIADVKLVNIINILLKLLIRSDKNDKRASYRKLNDNCNEQYTANDRC